MFLFAFLRLIHVLSAVLWAGASFMMVLFVMPSARKLGPDGGKFMQQLSRTNGFVIVVNLAAVLTILSGAYVYWKVSGGLNADWMKSSYGAILTTGIVLGIIAWLIGFIVQRPTAQAIASLGKEIAGSGGPPTDEQKEKMDRLQKRLFKGAHYVSVFIFLSLITMPIARYLHF